MSGIALPIDAIGGAPAFPAAQHRVAMAALMGGAVPARPLGARSGVRPGAVPTLTLSGLNWTLTPFNGVIDPGTSLAVGPYQFAFLANETGAITAADATYGRIDRLDLQVPDDPPGNLPRAATIVYTAGTPASVPAAPAAPAQSMPLGTFTVPKSGSGNPAFTPAIPMAVAAGGILPVSSGAYPANPYRGMYVDDAALGLLRWNGTAWKSAADTEYETIVTTVSTVVGQSNATRLLSFAKPYGGVPPVCIPTVRNPTFGQSWTSYISSVSATQVNVGIAKMDGSNAGSVAAIGVDILVVRKTA